MNGFVKGCVAIVWALIVAVDCKIPDYIQVCHHNNPNLGDCIKNSVEALRPHLKVGIAELGVPPLEPFRMDAVTVDRRTSSSYLGTNLTDIVVRGASDYKVLKIIPTLMKNGYGFSYEVVIPRLHIEGRYAIDTKVLFLQLRGNGPFNTNITDYHFACLMKGKKVPRDGNDYLIFDPMKCNLEVGKVEIYLENLFDGNPILGKATNDAINDNSQAFFQEIKPTVLNAISLRFTEIANKITSTFTYNELFP